MQRRDFLRTASLAVGLAAGEMSWISPRRYQTAHPGDVICRSLMIESPAESLELRVGLRLVPVLTHSPEVPLLNGIRQLRSELRSQKIALPIVRIRDDVRLVDDGFVILQHGVVVSAGQLTARQIAQPDGYRGFLDALTDVVLKHAHELPAC